MIAATAGMVVASLALTVFAGPLFTLSEKAGSNLEGPGFYVGIVFPEADDE
jgi:multicomponent Na+:H+ antiporter subunit D